MGKRKDTKGRVLEKGECQRKDGTYMYRWTDRNGKRQTIYATTLNELRQKELDITKIEKIMGSTWESGKITVRELVNKHRKLKSVKETTEEKYKYFDAIMDRIGLSDVLIKDIKTSDVKAYMKVLSELGYAYGTIQNFKASLSPAFKEAVDDDILMKNPFAFRLCDVVDDDSKVRKAMTVEQEKLYVKLIKEDGAFKHIVPDIIILLNTGLRVSELYGLTFKDIDFKNNRIHINKQLHLINGKYIIITPKSDAGNRTLAMTKEVREMFIQKFLDPRPITPYIIDGYTDFVFINRNKRPKTRKNLQMSMKTAREKFLEQGLGDFTDVTPHILRHTFCTRMVENGIDVKTLQLIMGHSDISTTLNIYTTIENEKVAEKMEQMIG